MTGEPMDRDRGSLVIALAIILILGMLASAVTLRAIGAAFISAGHQHAAAAVSQADAGLADALFRIDEGQTGSGSAFCVKPGDSKCLAASVPAAPGVSYLATQVSATDWKVESTATVNGQTAAVQGEVTQQLEYPFVLFGKRLLDFRGFASSGFSTYDPNAPGSASNPNPNGDVSIGSNGTITCNGGLGTNVAVAYYGTGGVASTGTSACGSYQSYPNLYYLPTPAAPDNPLPCPGITGTVAEGSTQTVASELGTGFPGAPTTIAAGNYLCTTPVAMKGVVTIVGAVQLNIILDGTYDSSTQALIIVGGSTGTGLTYINDPYDACLAGAITGCHPTPNLPTSQNLQILTNSTGTVGNDAGQGYYLGAILYAPLASLTQDGCKSHYYGTVVISALTCSGGPNLFVSYDSTLSTVYGPWTPGAYSQINPATFTAAMTASGL
jgi:hypothetical protein